MYSVDEALSRILTALRPLGETRLPLLKARGRVLAQPIHAPHDLPPFANSSMDGFALRAADAREPGAILRVTGDLPAGKVAQTPLGAGEAMRIMTGAPLPTGADAVIPYEATNYASMTDPLPQHVTLANAVKVGDSVRPLGEDVRHGDLILEPGRTLRSADIGILAGLGIAEVTVRAAPRVALLSTGDELLEPGEPLQPGKIYDMNSYSIAALLEEAGAEVLYLGIARDTAAQVIARLRPAFEYGADLLLSTGGVSVGAYDPVKEVIEQDGTLNFWKVNLRPGKPLAFGQVRGIPYIGLPGNPVSAMVTFDVFVRPALLKMMGKDPTPDHAEAVTAEPLQSDGRRTYMRVRLEKRNGLLMARTTGTQSSGALSSLVKADGLLIIPEGMTDVPAGTRLPVRLL